MREKIVIDKGGRGSKGYMGLGSVYTWDILQWSMYVNANSHEIRYLYKSSRPTKNQILPQKFMLTETYPQPK